MTSIAPIAPEDHAEWLELWNGYLTFYESRLDDETTAATFERLADASSDIHGASLATRTARRSGSFIG